MTAGKRDFGKRIVVSLHDVTPRHFERLLRIDRFLENVGLGGCYSMLVVPNFWYRWPLREHRDFQAWLRARSDAGVEMVLHGYHHVDETSHPAAATRWKARVLTAGEGEFLGLGEPEAIRRLVLGRELLESIVGRPVLGFVAPAWLYGHAALRALGQLGFRFAEDHWRVWCPRTGATLARSPVVSYASRSSARIAGSLAWSRVARAALAPARVVRLAVHPHDFDESRLVGEIDRALRRFLAVRRPSLYRELAGQ
ncbi:MAG: polysaccharide deacetylase family protein [Deltaproteobacteria bacterium]|nr:polysaccharide deacetylase family protein [Deltaproteobacteria bacterium]